jgi:hypothetical protein
MVVSQSDTEVLGAQAALRYQSNALDTFIGIGLQYAYRFRQPATQTEANDMTELNANKAAGAAGYPTGFGKPPLHTSLRTTSRAIRLGGRQRSDAILAQMVAGQIFKIP